MNKKFLTLLIVSFLFVNIFAVSAFAETAPSVTVGNAIGSTGNTVEIPVTISDNVGFASLGIEIGYDSSALKLVDVTANGNIGATFTNAQSYIVNPYNMSWDSASNTSFNGTLATFTFEIITNVNGTYPITVDYYKGRNGNYVDGVNVNYNESFQALGLTYKSGAIVVNNSYDNSLSINSNGQISLSGEVNVGNVFVAVYKDDMLKDLHIYSASKTINIDMTLYETGDIIKAMWMKKNLKSMCKPATIIVP